MPSRRMSTDPWDAGWKRNALQVNYFAPWDLLQPDPSFLSMVNRVLVPPILQTLVFSAAPEEVRCCAAPKEAIVGLLAHELQVPQNPLVQGPVWSRVHGHFAGCLAYSLATLNCLGHRA